MPTLSSPFIQQEEKIQTFQLNCDGGLILNVGSLQLSEEQPGAAVNLVNMEVDLLGGYRRINGYVKYITAPVPDYVNIAGSPQPNPGNPNPVNGVCVFNNGVIAARGDYIYFCATTGTSWTRINPSDPFTNTTGVRFFKYNWAAPTVLITNGVTVPYKWDGTTLTKLTNAPGYATYACIYEGYLWICCPNNPFLISYSAPYAENDWSVPDGAGQINLGKIVLGIKQFRDTLYFFCNTAIFKLTGSSWATSSSDPYILSPVTDDIGCVSPDTIQEIGGDLVFLAPDGIRPISGTNRIGDVQLATISVPINSYIYSNLSQPRVMGMVVHAKSQYRLFFNSINNSQQNAVGAIGCLRQDGWEFGKLSGINAYCGHSDYINNVEYVVHGDYNGYVYRQEVGYAFDGANILSVYTTPPLTFNDPTLRKTIFKIKLFGEYEGNYSINLGVSLDQSKPGLPQPANVLVIDMSNPSIYSRVKYGTAVYGQRPANETNNNVIGSGFTFSLSFSTNDQNPSHTFKSITAEYALAGRQ